VDRLYFCEQHAGSFIHDYRPIQGHRNPGEAAQAFLVEGQIAYRAKVSQGKGFGGSVPIAHHLRERELSEYGGMLGCRDGNLYDSGECMHEGMFFLCGRNGKARVSGSGGALSGGGSDSKDGGTACGHHFGEPG